MANKEDCMTILVTLKWIIFPKDGRPNDGDYVIASYAPEEPMVTKSGVPVTRFVAKGYCLPTGRDQVYELEGRWKPNNKSELGYDFECTNYQEVVGDTRADIINYLASGQIKGIRKKTAERIYDRFGPDTLRVLDECPERISEIKGITKRRLKGIIDSYTASRGARRIIALLAPYDIHINNILRVYRSMGTEAVTRVKADPYLLLRFGVTFKKADRIAGDCGITGGNPVRVCGAVMSQLTDLERCGNMCYPYAPLLENVMALINPIEQKVVEDEIGKLISNGHLVVRENLVYNRKNAIVEKNLSLAVTRAAQWRPKFKIEQNAITKGISNVEFENHIKFDDEQKSAIRMALSSGASVITGGPGTGKTSIQKAIISVFENEVGGDILLCAPTGRASRRMSESTGYSAMTLHRAMGLKAEEDAPDPLEADLVIVDEFSMVDSELAEKLFESIKKGSRLILIGDSDQLPSVKAGAVLQELISSGEIPVSRLLTVHRQKDGSTIAENAKRIRENDPNFVYDDSYQLIETGTAADTVEEVKKQYLSAVNDVGIDNVALLTPFRRKTERSGGLSSTELNEQLRAELNPPAPDKAEVRVNSLVFREGDKILQLKNRRDEDGVEVSNGDVGYITRIIIDDDDCVYVNVDFHDGRIVEYDRGDMEDITWGYALSIHKSQGSEYKTVILVMREEHRIMLKKPLLYTAVTRAKDRLIIVGQQEAVNRAASTDETQTRHTCLGSLIKGAAKKSKSA